MRRWRVGTLSMGVLLIAFGILMVVAKINQSTALSIIVKWWPAVLILLGGEVLWFSYSSKEDSPKVKYDVFSIIIIFFITICSLGIYSLSQIGLISQAQKMISAQNYVLHITDKVIPAGDDVKRIVIQSVQVPVTVRLTDEKLLRVQGTADVTADNQDTAQKLLNNCQVLTTRSGDVLYLSFNSAFGGSDLGYHARIRNYTLFIPKDKAGEIENDCSLDFWADTLGNSWVISGSGGSDIKLGKGAEAQINVSGSQPIDLRGNIKWKKSSQEKNGEEIFQTYTWGTGKYKINIMETGSVNVTKI